MFASCRYVGIEPLFHVEVSRRKMDDPTVPLPFDQPRPALTPTPIFTEKRMTLGAVIKEALADAALLERLADAQPRSRRSLLDDGSCGPACAQAPQPSDPPGRHLRAVS